MEEPVHPRRVWKAGTGLAKVQKMTGKQMRDLVRMQHQVRTRQYAEMLACWPQPLGFDLIDADVDQWGQAVFGRWGGWLLGINEMLVNERLVMWREADGGTMAPNVPVFGWCYPKRGLAIAALITFDPASMGEPQGYTKRALRERQAGVTADMVRW